MTPYFKLVVLGAILPVILSMFAGGLIALAEIRFGWNPSLMSIVYGLVLVAYVAVVWGRVGV